MSNIIKLDASASIAEGTKALAELSPANWTEERHLKAVAALAKIKANAAALKSVLDAYEERVKKLAKANGFNVEGATQVKVIQLDGSVRDVDVHVYVGEASETRTTLDTTAIHAETGYTCDTDAEDPCKKVIRVADPSLCAERADPVGRRGPNGSIRLSL